MDYPPLDIQYSLNFYRTISSGIGISKDRLIGFMDTSGAIAVPLEYQDVGNFKSWREMNKTRRVITFGQEQLRAAWFI
jgi:hypothetical protein